MGKGSLGSTKPRGLDSRSLKCINLASIAVAIIPDDSDQKPVPLIHMKFTGPTIPIMCHLLMSFLE